jgi:hypothetical protein
MLGQALKTDELLLNLLNNSSKASGSVCKVTTATEHFPHNMHDIVYVRNLHPEMAYVPSTTI